MDYYQIGQNIRKFRKAKQYSQEYLAEKCGISVTHMSHIETGNTKLSLPVLVSIASALEVQTDDILSENGSLVKSSYEKLNEVFNRCSAKQLKIIAEIVQSAKIALDKYE